MKKVSILTACYNEEENVRELFYTVRDVMATMPQYEFEHVFIDNCSRDSTPQILSQLASEDKRVKVIFNARNFGHIRSPYHGLIQCRGDVVISLVADFQDPPDMLPQMLAAWERGKKVVIGVKKKSKENPLMFAARTMYYKLMSGVSDLEHIENFTGFGLYDATFVEVLRSIDDPYPYFRGIVAEYAFNLEIIEYVQPKRLHGKTKNNFFTLFDMALLGMVNHTKAPLRVLTLVGFFMSLVSFGIGIYYLVDKLLNWDRVGVGVAPLLIGLFFIGSIQMLFMGLVGEYIGAIHTQTKKRPRVVEKGRLNF